MGESIGLFANETQLAAWAAKELGTDWKTLDEAGKQVARLEYAKAMQEAAGATGQASRESDGLQNQLGNLRQVWDDLLAKFGEPVLETVVGWIKTLADTIMATDFQPYIDAFTGVFETLKQVGTFVTEVIGYFTQLKDEGSGRFNEFKDVATESFKAIQEFVQPAIEAVVSFVSNKLSELKAFWDANGQQIMQAVKNVWNGIKAVIDFVMPAILFIVKSVWNNIKGVIDGVLNVIMGLVKVFAGLFTGDFRKMWEGVKQIFSGAIEAVWNAFNLLLYGRLLKAGAALFTGLRTAFANGWSALLGQTKNGIKFVTSSFDDMVRAVRTTFGNVVNAIKTKWDEAMTFLRNIDLRQIGDDIISGLVNGIKSGFSRVKSIVSDLAKLIPDTVSSLLGIKSPSRLMAEKGEDTGQGFINGLTSQLSGVTRASDKLANAAMIDAGYTTPSVSAGARGVVRGASAYGINGGTNYNGNVHVTISAKDVAEFNSVVDFFEALPQQIRKN